MYRSPEIDTNQRLVILGAIGLSLVVFLVLPLTQMMSKPRKPDLTLNEVDSVMEPPPPPPKEKEPPPPEKDEQEPEPELEQQAKKPALQDMNLNVDVGTGGVLQDGMASIENAKKAAEDLAAFDMSELDKHPVLLASVSPRYPRELRQSKVEGRVLVTFIVNEEGEVIRPRVESATRPEFKEPALEAIRKWRFKPGRKNGEPVSTHVRVPIRFRVSS